MTMSSAATCCGIFILITRSSLIPAVGPFGKQVSPDYFAFMSNPVTRETIQRFTEKYPFKIAIIHYRELYMIIDFLRAGVIGDFYTLNRMPPSWFTNHSSPHSCRKYTPSTSLPCASGRSENRRSCVTSSIFIFFIARNSRGPSTIFTKRMLATTICLNRSTCKLWFLGSGRKNSNFRHWRKDTTRLVIDREQK